MHNYTEITTEIAKKNIENTAATKDVDPKKLFAELSKHIKTLPAKNRLQQFFSGE